MFMPFWTKALLLLVAAGFQASAATGWERLSDLHPGDRITVRQTDRKELNGEFVSVSPTGITIRPGASFERTIARAEVARVQTSKKKTLRNMAIGAAIG